jgi:hypothetical protein
MGWKPQYDLPNLRAMGAPGGELKPKKSPKNKSPSELLFTITGIRTEKFVKIIKSEIQPVFQTSLILITCFSEYPL